jgi:hypothetical protein
LSLRSGHRIWNQHEVVADPVCPDPTKGEEAAIGDDDMTISPLRSKESFNATSKAIWSASAGLGGFRLMRGESSSATAVVVKIAITRSGAAACGFILGLGQTQMMAKSL